MEKYDKEKQLKYLLENKDKLFSIWAEQEIARYIAEEKFSNSYEEFEMRELNIDPNSEEFQEKKNKEISKYENDLMKLDFNNLGDQFIEIEKKHYDRYKNLNQVSRLQNCDIMFWAKKSIWSFEEFMMLKNNINPNYKPKQLKKYNIYFNIFNDLMSAECKILTMDHNSFEKDYIVIYDLVSDAILCNELNKIRGEERQEDFEPKHLYNHDKFKRNDLMNWCKENDISLPKEFLEKKSISELEEENQDLKNQINDLQKKLKEKEDQRIIKTLNKIIKGMTDKHYADKTTRISKIKSTLDLQGINISQRCLQDRIKEASEEDQSENGNI